MKAKTFSLPDQDGNIISLKDFKGKYLVLYFYPKDATSGCTIEAIDFTSLKDEFTKLNAKIVGVSPDSKESHCKFIQKENLRITLLADTEKKILEKYEVYKEKSMYGRKYMGVIRTTLLIDKEQNIVKRWDRVRVKDHAKEVLETLKENHS